MSIENEVAQLKISLETVLDPSTKQILRHQAYETLEKFKDSSPNLLQCAQLLADIQQPPFVRHFGLQLIEHTIKERWNAITQEEKVLVKDLSIKFMQVGVQDIVTEQRYIKDGIAKNVVEMAKREWPQNWANMLQEINECAQMGACQTEIALIIYMRLSEDVVTFQCLPQTRRRQVLSAITANLKEMFEFFTNTLNNSLKMLSDAKLANDTVIGNTMCHLSSAVLLTLQSYVDWVPIKHITTNQGLLLQLLVLALKEPLLQNLSVDALNLIASRKGRVEDRKPLLILLSEDAMVNITEAAGVASQTITEPCYIFLKHLCEFLVSLTQQLMFLWDTLEGDSPREDLQLVLKALISFSQHPAQYLASMALAVWSTLFHHETISKESILQQYIPQLAQIAKTTILKIGNPMLNNHVSCQYSRFESDNKEYFNVFFTKLRNESSVLLRHLTTFQPATTMSVVEEWLKELLVKPINTGSESPLCDYNSPSYIEWDGLSSYMDSVMAKVFQLEETHVQYQQSVEILKSLLNYHVEDAVIMVTIISSIYVVIPALKIAPSFLPITLEKFFHFVVYNSKDETVRSKAVSILRRTACVTFVRSCKHHRKILVPFFDQILAHIQQLTAEPDTLQGVERNSLNDGLFLLSNEFCNYEKQKVFLEELLTPMVQKWNSTELKEAIMSVDNFLVYIGVNLDANDETAMEEAGKHRMSIISCVNVILSLMRSVVLPTDIEMLKQGGYIINEQISNPCSATVSALLDNVLILIRTLNALFVPSNLAKRNPMFSDCYALPPNERTTMLGKLYVSAPVLETTRKTNLERVQYFVFNLFEDCCHVLGMTGSVMSHDLYRAPNLATSLMNSVLTNVDYMPDYKLRSLIRVFLRPFVSHCPCEYYETSVLRVVAAICPYMLERVTKSWHDYNQKVAEDNGEEDNQEEEEIIQEQQLRMLTRDYAAFINQLVLTTNKSNGTESVHPDQDQILSPLCHIILQWENIFPPVLLSAFNSLIWNDGPSCGANLTACLLLLKQLISDNKLNIEDSCHIFNLILRGIQMHGNDESNLSRLLQLAVTSYELMRPNVVQLQTILMQIQGVSEDSIKIFEAKFLCEAGKTASIKRKKDMFRRIINSIIPIDVGQQHKREIVIKDLAPILQKSRPRRKALVEIIGDEDIGLCHLFNS